MYSQYSGALLRTNCERFLDVETCVNLSVIPVFMLQLLPRKVGRGCQCCPGGPTIGRGPKPHSFGPVAVLLRSALASPGRALVVLVCRPDAAFPQAPSGWRENLRSLAM